MALEARLVQKLGQSLLMTPQLQQAIKLLQLGRLEYKEALERELMENPILEELPQSEEPIAAANQVAGEDTTPSLQNASVPENEPTSEPQKEGPEWEEYIENLFSESRTLPSGSNSAGDYEDRPSLEATLTRSETLQEHLFSQL
jgi:RNA polymerase sigma-54 factor